MNRKIGVFDSGIGGLSVLKELINIVIDSFKYTKKEELKDFLNNIFRNKK